MRASPTAAGFFIGLFIGAGLVVAAWQLSAALPNLKTADRHVTVKGLSERIVAADLALWPLVFSVTADDLVSLQADVEDKQATIESFLRQRGFSDDEISRATPRINDQWANSYGGNRPPERYQAEATVTLRSANVAAVKSAMQASGELVSQGVTLIRSYEYQPQFLFTALDDVKPEMIAEATADARAAAEQFARDAEANVGTIRQASQGYFSVTDRDPFSPEFKKVRVVTTIDFFLQ